MFPETQDILIKMIICHHAYPVPYYIHHKQAYMTTFWSPNPTAFGYFLWLYKSTPVENIQKNLVTQGWTPGELSLFLELACDYSADCQIISYAEFNRFTS